MAEICSKSLARAIGKSITHETERKHLLKTHKGDEKWPLFVDKRLFWWSVSIPLDNNNKVLTDL